MNVWHYISCPQEKGVAEEKLLGTSEVSCFLYYL
jgi:hypothetical protein